MGWQYTLTVDDEPWGHGRGIDGLFEGADQVVLRRLAVRGAVAGRLVDVGTRKTRRQDAELTLLLPSGQPAGTYDLIGFLPTAVRMSPGTAGLVDLTTRAHRDVVEGAGAVWELVRAGRLDRPGLWRSYGRRAWLSVALKRQVRGQAGVLDGRDVVDVDAFYCALGEAVNGPGGYYGWNLDAMDDCLHGGFGPMPPFTLRWQESAVARQRLPEFETVLTILRESGVDVRLE
jgi:RNAse (barnase) inhibitor barstar